MWDAQEQYWKGYEWTKNLGEGVGQPTFRDQQAGNYPKSNTDSRWYNEAYTYGADNKATHTPCKDLPNANELSWYVVYGDPRWDDELWTTMGHLYKGGMWFKKKSVLQADGNYDTEKSADRTTDLRTTYKNYYNNSSSITNSGLPSIVDAGNYFYLPALGSYYFGLLNTVGGGGFYWSSSAIASNSAYSLVFAGNNVQLNYNVSFFGFRVEPTFE